MEKTGGFILRRFWLKENFNNETLKGIAGMLSLFYYKKGVLYEKLDQIRQESKEVKDKIDDTEERLRQLKNQEKKILKQDIVKVRKERTHRLITREAILESLIENAEELTDEEIKILPEESTKTKESKETLRIIKRRNIQSSSRLVRRRIGTFRIKT